MDLRRRNKQHVMETMDGKTPAPRAHEFACAHGDELLIQRVGATGLAVPRPEPGQPDAGGADVFVHISAVERAGLHGLNEGQKIAYEIVADKRTGKSSAENLKPA